MEVPGRQLSDFDIEQELGHGSFGMVYKVKSLRNGGTYVIKKINIDHLPQKSQKEVIHEAQILKKINHPNIVKYHCSFMEGKCLCIVMEYIDGGDLHKLLKAYQEKKQHITESEIWRMAYELSSAILYLHSKSIIHRDIKTMNILITKSNKIKLADLGASKIVSAPMQITRVGTPLYLAPELVKHKPYDYKVDVWALGCVIYTLAKLQPPFQAENLITLGIHIVSKTPEPIPSSYSSILSNFVMSLLSKQPIDRPNISTVMSMIPKAYYKVISIEEEPTNATIERYSPVVDDENYGTNWKGCPKPCNPVFDQSEPFPATFASNRVDDLLYRFDERPSTANKRVVFKFESRSRPASAVMKKNPLYVPRDLHMLRIPQVYLKIQFHNRKVNKKYVTINDI
jgi:NIMA (never in mitosis gene a)-related kinase 1/4/5